MFCFSNPQRGRLTTPDEHVLICARPDSLQVPNIRNQVYYQTDRLLDLSPLQVAQRSQHRILARSRESAKRFWRLNLSHVSQNLGPGIGHDSQDLQASPVVDNGQGMVARDDLQHLSRSHGDSDMSRVGGSMSQGAGRGNPGSENRPRDTRDAVETLTAIRDEKPIASGNGISVAISLAEPVLYLQGFDPADSTSSRTTMLRGSLHLRVTKQAKLKSISLKFRGRSETEWPEGIPPKKTEFRDTESIMSHTWPFFHAQFPQAENSYCADIVQLSKGPVIATKELGVSTTSFDFFQRSASPHPGMTAKNMKRLSLQANQSRSFGKGETMNGAPSVSQKGFKVFHPGDYIYNFELPVDSRLPESINLELGTVKYELEAVVERAGAFRANLVGVRELTMIRTPGEASLEQIEPIAISRNWEDQLHYDIVISGKSFPMGATIPIAFKLTPLAKVQCHRIKVLVTENVQYFTANKKVHRLEPTRKMQLFEKRADGKSTSAFPGSSIHVTSGGGVSWDHRDAAARGEEDVSRDQSNLLGNLEAGSTNIGPTELEINVKLPGCHEMKDKAKTEKLHFDTTHQSIQVNHWIKIIMRLSRPDDRDPSKRRHFEISIDSPFHILSCRATAANTALPVYSTGRTPALPADEHECGCPGAAMKRGKASSISAPGGLSNSSTSTPQPQSTNWSGNTGGLAAPRPAHVHDPSSGVQDLNTGVARPIHLVRNPSFNPPAFADEEPPPPLITPPPNYENIVGGDARYALADYFSRLADEMGEEDGEDAGLGRVDVPLTPGGRVHRSMDASRTWLPLGTSAAENQ